jgi:lysozyme
MALADRLLQNEGLRLTVYDDYNGKAIQPGSQVIGKPTIGIGTLICAPGGITEAEARLLLGNRIAIATNAVIGLSTLLSQDDPRFDVLVEMSFQLGSTGLAQFVNTLQAVREKRWNDAADGMLNSRWATQTPARAQALAAIMRSGQP